MINGYSQLNVDMTFSLDSASNDFLLDNKVEVYNTIKDIIKLKKPMIYSGKITITGVDYISPIMPVTFSWEEGSRIAIAVMGAPIPVGTADYVAIRLLIDFTDEDLSGYLIPFNFVS